MRPFDGIKDIVRSSIPIFVVVCIVISFPNPSSEYLSTLNFISLMMPGKDMSVHPSSGREEQLTASPISSIICVFSSLIIGLSSIQCPLSATLIYSALVSQ